MRENLSGQGSSNSLEPPENLGAFDTDATIVNDSNRTSRFLNSNVEFFDFFYDKKSSNIKIDIKYKEKKTYFRDVLVFINRIKNVIRVKNTKLLRNNL